VKSLKNGQRCAEEPEHIGFSIMLLKILSDGQNGPPQAAWRAARAFGISSGGWMISGFLTDDGERPEFAERYGAAELPECKHLTSIEKNVQESDATLWFGETTTQKAQATATACERFGKACMPIDPCASFEPSHVATWIAQSKVRTLNVAGNRERDEPGIGNRVESFLHEVLQQLGHTRA
jgi:hypothetical protein